MRGGAKKGKRKARGGKRKADLVMSSGFFDGMMPPGLIPGDPPFGIPPAPDGEVRHVVIDRPEGGIPWEKEPIVEMVIATDDDLEPGCPCCEPLRKRVANGEEIEIARVRWE